MLTKKDFIDCDPDKDAVIKEDSIRKWITEVFNKKRKDFASAEEYDCYLEMIEDYIFVLGDPDSSVEETNKIREIRE